jgi:hypothetical protein
MEISQFGKQFRKQLCFIALGGATFALAAPVFAQDAAPPPPGEMQHGEGHGMGMGRGVRGTVTAVAGNQATIKTDEGDVYTVTTGENTHLMKHREAATAADIHVGDMLMVGGQVDAQAKTVGAAFVQIIDAADVQKMRADLGKTWTAGKITAIDGTKITVDRIDGVSQTIAVDENTSFHKHRDAVTLADFKVGDSINARGGLKDGVFVAAQLSGGPMGMGPMGRGPGGSGGPGGWHGEGAAPAPQNAPSPQ